MERVRHHQMCLEIRIIWRTLTSLAQAAISQRQSSFGSSSSVPVWSCTGTPQTLLPKPGLLPDQGVCLTASPLATHSQPPAWDGIITPGQMQICSCCCSWPGFELDEFLGVTQRLTKTQRGIGGDLVLGGRVCCFSSQQGMFSIMSSLGAVLMLLHGLWVWLLSGWSGEGGEVPACFQSLV